MKVGVIVPLHAPFDIDTPEARSYRELRTLFTTAEDAGLDSAWVTDHLLFRFPPGRVPAGEQTLHSHEAFTIWAGLAEATSRIELGSMVLCTAFRNPAVMTKEAVSLDEVAGHRVTLGLGCGWHKPEFDAFGIPFTHVVSRFEEAMSIVHPLLREGRVTFEGEHSRAVDCELVPPDRRPGGIPILIASKQPRMMDLTARFADQWNGAWYGDLSGGYLDDAANLDAACERVGRDPATLAKTAGVMVDITDDGVDTTGAAEGGPAAEDDPAKVVRGPAELVAEVLRAYADAGCAHVIANLPGLSPEKVSRLAEAARMAGLLTAPSTDQVSI